jgi:gamma-glutamylcyclotransferase (GGCT)/AIG2-like uncharacterized protein YtfP
MMHHVFVYGTLLRGCHNHHVLGDEATFIGRGITVDNTFTMLCNGAYPYVKDAVPSEPHAHITGELYRVDDEALERLDRLEGVPHHYYRQDVEIVLMDEWGETHYPEGTHTAKMYLCDHPHGHRVPHGDWRAHTYEGCGI